MFRGLDFMLKLCASYLVTELRSFLLGNAAAALNIISKHSRNFP